jgi:hypothetical protein
MTIMSRLFAGTVAATFATTFLSAVPGACLAESEVVSHSKNIVVELPASLPELARRHGIAEQVYSESSDGSCYLYIEQHQGERLLVLNVTDPARVKQVNAVPLAVPGPFDFVRILGGSAYLIRFRNNLGMAVLDLRKPKTPVLKIAGALEYPGQTESIGNSAFLMVSDHQMNAPGIPRDYQVVDTSNPEDTSLLFTVKQVNCEIARDETGTTFLLGSDGLTIIRRPRAEERYKQAQSYTN